MEEEDEIALQTEVEIFSQLDHPNVVKLYEIFDENDFLYLILELMSGGEVIYTRIFSNHMNSYSIELSKRSTTQKRKHLTLLDQLSMRSDTVTLWVSSIEISR